MNIIESNLNFRESNVRNGPPKCIVLHHAAAKTASVETVHNWHLNNGWIGIGYHFYVRKDGKVYRGRPENWIGAHTVGKNTGLGICAEGNFEEEQMDAAQKNAIIELLRYLLAKYGDLTIGKHKDYSATACPGKNYPFAEIVKAAREEGTQATEETQQETETGILTVDGIWGEATTRRLQEIFGTTVDGKVSNQHAKYKATNPGLTTGWEWYVKPNGKGSKLIRAMQSWAGMPNSDRDGELGPQTIRAIQKKLGTTQDGVVSKPSQMVKALQKWANSK